MTGCKCNSERVIIYPLQNKERGFEPGQIIELRCPNGHPSLFIEIGRREYDKKVQKMRAR